MGITSAKFPTVWVCQPVIQILIKAWDCPWVSVVGTNLQELILTSDSEHELFNYDIAQVLQNIKKENLLRLTKYTIARQVLRIMSWIYESATKFSPCSWPFQSPASYGRDPQATRLSSAAVYSYYTWFSFFIDPSSHYRVNCHELIISALSVPFGGEFRYVRH